MIDTSDQVRHRNGNTLAPALKPGDTVGIVSPSWFGGETLDFGFDSVTNRFTITQAECMESIRLDPDGTHHVPKNGIRRS